MNFNSVVINKVDNGYVVNIQKSIFGQERPEQTINVFTSLDDVIAYITGTPVATPAPADPAPAIATA